MSIVSEEDDPIAAAQMCSGYRIEPEEPPSPGRLEMQRRVEKLWTIEDRLRKEGDLVMQTSDGDLDAPIVYVRVREEKVGNSIEARREVARRYAERVLRTLTSECPPDVELAAAKAARASAEARVEQIEADLKVLRHDNKDLLQTVQRLQLERNEASAQHDRACTTITAIAAALGTPPACDVVTDAKRIARIARLADSAKPIMERQQAEIGRLADRCTRAELALGCIREALGDGRTGRPVFGEHGEVAEERRSTLPELVEDVERVVGECVVDEAAWEALANRDIVGTHRCPRCGVHELATTDADGLPTTKADCACGELYGYIGPVPQLIDLYDRATQGPKPVLVDYVRRAIAALRVTGEHREANAIEADLGALLGTTR